MKQRLLLLGLTIALSLILGFVTFTPLQALQLVKSAGYYYVLLTFVLFCGAVGAVISWRELWPKFRQGGWKIVLIIAAISAFAHVHERHGFKVLMDELVLLSTSMRMHQTREVSTVARGYGLGNNFVIMQGAVDKRPLFFPFLLTVLHDATGYRPENAFWLNALLTPLLFGLIYLVVARLVGRAGGIAAMLLLATIPLLIQTLTSGGFEVLNLVMILATLLLGMEYARRPTAASLTAFCLSGVLLAQVRYESVLAIAPVGLTVLYVWWRERKIELPLLVVACPLLLVIYPLQLNVLKLSPDLWQMKDRPSESGIFSLDYLWGNVGHALNHFLSFDFSQSGSPLVFGVGVVGVAFLVLLLWRRRGELKQQSDWMVWTVFFAYLAAHTLLMLCYFWGMFDDVLTARLSLPTQLMMVLASATVYPALVRHSRGWAALIAVAASWGAVWTLPAVTRRAHAYSNMTAQTAEWLDGFVERRPLPPRTVVIDAQLPLFWLTREIPTFTISMLAARHDEFLYHYNRRSFHEYLVVQRMIVSDFESGRRDPLDMHRFGGGLELETLEEVALTPAYWVRVSRVTRVDEEKFRAWALRRIEIERETGSSTAPDTGGADTAKAEAAYIQEWLRKLP